MTKNLMFVLFVLLAGVALAQDHSSNMTENRPDAKVFRWGENRAGDCHQEGATLIIRPNGTASFSSVVWTHTHGTDVWHSTIHLRGAGGNLGDSPNFDSPGMPHNADGPEHKRQFNYEFTFPAGNFNGITVAVEHSAC